MSERRLTIEILAECERLGLLAHHCPDVRRCEGRRGMPDLLVLGSTLLLAELKDRDGDTSASQDMWLYRLHRAGIPYAVWRPQDLADGLIQAKLREMA